jgi:flagellum-specific peptidoglycan hydrolase FlgJ
MADNYSPEDLQRIQAEYAYHLEKGIPISKELATEFKNAQIGIKNYTQELNKSFSQLGNGLLNTAAALKDGAQGSSVFNQNIKDGSDVLAKFLERIPYVGKALAALAKGAATYAVEANKQSDALYKSYQELSRFGQATASGMDDVFSTMQKFSYGIGELDQMTALLRDNAKSLALFGGTVAQGTDRIANTANEFKESGLQEYFMKMGASVDTQNRAIAGYAKQLTNFGQAQGKTQAELTKGAADYLRQMEGLTRLTGQTREEMEQQREQAMAVDQFAAVVSELDPKAAAEVQATFDILMKLDPAKARAFAESMGGYLTGSKEQNQLFQSSGGQILNLVDGLKKGTMRAGEAVDQMFPKGKALEFQRQLAKMGTGADFMGGFSGSLKANNQSMKEAQETAEGQTAVTGELTDAAVDLRQSQMKARDALQSMINDGVLPATKSMAALAKVTEIAAEGSKGFWDKALDKLSDWTGIGSGSKGSKGEKPQEFSGNQKEFYDKMYGTLLEEAKKQKLANPEAIARLGASQSALETGYGKHTAGSQNYFGIKARPGEEGSGGKETQEFINGKMVTVKDKFRKYNNMNESAADYVKFLQENKRYKGVLEAKTAEEAIAAQAKTGYATDPNYGNKLANIHASAQKNTAPNQPATPTTTPSATGNKQDSDAMAKMNAQWQKQYPTVPIEGATGFNGMLTGPTSGYKPDITMHGTENLKITPIDRPDQTAIPGMDTTIMSQQLSKMDQLVQAFNNTSTQDMMAMQLNKLDELVRVMQNQVNVSTKILQQSR